jgi:hypothetical protein
MNKAITTCSSRVFLLGAEKLLIGVGSRIQPINYDIWYFINPSWQIN